MTYRLTRRGRTVKRLSTGLVVLLFTLAFLTLATATLAAYLSQPTISFP